MLYEENNKAKRKRKKEKEKEREREREIVRSFVRSNPSWNKRVSI